MVNQTREIYPLVGKKVDKNAQPIQEQNAENKQENSIKRNACSKMCSNTLMYVLEPLLPDDGRKGEGKIASLLYLICLTTAGVVLNVSRWLQTDENAIGGVTADHIDGFLMTCICPALLWICYIFCKQNDRKTVDFITPTPHHHRPLMAGSYVFGAGSCVMDLLHIAFYIECSTNFSSLFFSVFKALFIFAQILFLRKFATATLHKSQSIRLVLFHILGTNVCIWFRALFSHSRHIFQGIAEDDFDNGFCRNTASMKKIWEASEPYLYPFTMEYTLIAAGILYSMWSGMRDLDPDPQDIYIYDEFNDFQNSDNFSDKGDEDHGYGTCDGSPPFGNSMRYNSHMSLNRTVSNASLCQSCIENNHEQLPQNTVPSSDPGLLVGLLFSIVLLLAVGLLWVDSASLTALRFYFLYQIVLFAIMCIACWFVLKCLLTQKLNRYAFGADDTLLIVSFTGVFLYAGLCFTAAIAEYNNDKLLPGYSIAKSTLILFEAMLQVTVLTKGLRYKPYDEIGANIIRQGTLFLLTTNFALWAQDSFFELRNFKTTPVQTVFYGEVSWRGITILAYPLCIFFRFHSAACLFEVWSSFRTSVQ